MNEYFIRRSSKFCTKTLLNLTKHFGNILCKSRDNDVECQTITYEVTFQWKGDGIEERLRSELYRGSEYRERHVSSPQDTFQRKIESKQKASE